MGRWYHEIPAGSERDKWRGLTLEEAQDQITRRGGEASEQVRRAIAKRAAEGRFFWNVVMTGAAVVAAVAAVWLLVAQERRWNLEDRPQVVASYLEIENRKGPDYKYDWTFTNIGKEDATKLRIKIATVDSTHTRHTLLTEKSNVLPRLKRGQIVTAHP